jgi:1-deoxy-D-xylulose-5-phosphate reductoisomerase
MAVKRFLKGDIRYLQIYDMIERAMEHHERVDNPDVPEILEAERQTYEFLSSLQF